MFRAKTRIESLLHRFHFLWSVRPTGWDSTCKVFVKSISPAELDATIEPNSTWWAHMEQRRDGVVMMQVVRVPWRKNTSLAEAVRTARPTPLFVPRHLISFTAGEYRLLDTYTVWCMKN